MHVPDGLWCVYFCLYLSLYHCLHVGVCVCVCGVMWCCVFVSVCVQRSHLPRPVSVFGAHLYETDSLTHMYVCVFSLSHSNVCPPTGQCPNGLSCFPSLSLCKYSGSPSDFTRARPRSAHASLNAHTHTHMPYVTHTLHICLYLSLLLLQLVAWKEVNHSK